jgi:hypothetical protein
MKKKFNILMLALMLLVSYSAFSQKPPPTPGNPPPPGLPITSGIPYLLLAGVVYGIRALKNKS